MKAQDRKIASNNNAASPFANSTGINPPDTTIPYNQFPPAGGSGHYLPGATYTPGQFCLWTDNMGNTRLYVTLQGASTYPNGDPQDPSTGYWIQYSPAIT